MVNKSDTFLNRIHYNCCLLWKRAIENTTLTNAPTSSIMPTDDHYPQFINGMNRKFDNNRILSVSTTKMESNKLLHDNRRGSNNKRTIPTSSSFSSSPMMLEKSNNLDCLLISETADNKQQQQDKKQQYFSEADKNGSNRKLPENQRWRHFITTVSTLLAAILFAFRLCFCSTPFFDLSIVTLFTLYLIVSLLLPTFIDSFTKTITTKKLEPTKATIICMNSDNNADGFQLGRIISTLPRDLKGIFLLLKIRLLMSKKLRENRPLGDHFLEVVRRNPDKQCLIEVETGRSMTFKQFNGHANKFANFFKEKSFHSGQTVALFMENGIEFFAAWVGLCKLGIASAWVNSNLRAEPLAHSISVLSTPSSPTITNDKCVAIVTIPSLLLTLLKTIEQNLKFNIKGNRPNIQIFVVLQPTTELIKARDIGDDLWKSVEKIFPDSLTDCSEPPRADGLTFQNVLCYIYTSGTTGAPKAAVIKHFRYYMMVTGVANAFGIRPDDRIYITMPMYHTAGGILGAGQMLIRGCTVCIRRKFSVSNFWRDCVRFKCTSSQYIGEICRYLLVQPPCPEENQHQVRLMYGNGLRPQIWADFVNRFRIAKIGELYGSTEGNSTLMNIDNHRGACGFMPILSRMPFLNRIYPVRLLKVDPETGEFVRDARGFCVACKPGDVGEIVGTIRPNDPLLRFEGYLNSADTAKKVILNATRPGDNVFTSGDVLYWDYCGYLYFRDRTGDTYRWKGENTSTTEVEGILQPLICIVDATVYGVRVPGREGSAGMIGVELKDGTDVQEFIISISKRLCDSLPSYAIPLFLRICERVEKTGTFKLKKALLQRDGFDPNMCNNNKNNDSGHHPRLFIWLSSNSGNSTATKDPNNQSEGNKKQNDLAQTSIKSLNHQSQFSSIGTGGGSYVPLTTEIYMEINYGKCEFI